eukprot:TRINITY_DN51826_c0_g4_i1.p1 TRINITY_DN51826_c0_g4~~TRINITY_DN51826_c0_g4_i1.p1  ORF type:complete len:337 (-),score=59.68 TRINITY_DN51826_c0_g4_i1:38-1018(-)
MDSDSVVREVAGCFACTVIATGMIVYALDLSRATTAFSSKCRETNADMWQRLVFLNFVIIFLSILISTVTLFIPDSPSWIIWTGNLFYSIGKFIQTGIFIVRYQLMSISMDMDSSTTLRLVWLANFVALAFNCIASTSLSDDLIAIAMFCFLFVHTLTNVTLLSLLLSPLTAHVEVMKKQSQSSSASGDGRPSPAMATAELNRLRRIQKHQTVIRFTVLSCAVSLIFTIFQSLVFCFANYIKPYPADSHDSSVLMDIYWWTFGAETAVCTYAPLLGYHRFRVMWKGSRTHQLLPAATEEEVRKLTTVEEEDRTRRASVDATDKLAN